MRPSAHDRVKSVFIRATQVPANERRRFVVGECADEATIRDEVLRLVDLREEFVSRTAPHGLVAAEAETAEQAGSTAREPSRDAPAPGTTIVDRYDLGEVIGAGAFGVVNRAVDRITRRDVAVKFVTLSGDRAREWYRREAATLLRARVPGVVELLDGGEIGGWGFFVMSLVEGTAFPGAGVTQRDVADILRRAAALLEAVQHLHAAGVYHRDLKPSNVLVGADGRVTLVDLGIAEDETDAKRWAPTRMVAGTRVYMSPERLRGDRATVRSDLYAVGVILAETLTGDPPRSGSRRCASDRRGPRKAAALVGEFGDDIPGCVIELIRSLLDPEPDRRPADATEALEILRRELGEEHRVALPRLGRDDAVRAIVDAALRGASIDVTGRRGAGKSRTLTDAAALLRADGRRVVRAEKSDDLHGTVRGIVATAPGDDALLPDDLDRALRERLTRQLESGLIVLADDFDDLDAATRDLLDDLRKHGSIARVVRSPTCDEGLVEIPFLVRDDLLPMIDAPSRIFHTKEDVADLLFERTRGCPAQILRQVESWCTSGLADWSGRLTVEPEMLRRLREGSLLPAPGRDRSTTFDRASTVVWNVLTLSGGALTQNRLAKVLGFPARVLGSHAQRLVDAGFADVTEDDRLVPLRASPDLATMDPKLRMKWSRRIAAELPRHAPERFTTLVAAELHSEACDAALEIGRRCLAEGRLREALGILNGALAIARRHGKPGRYDDLLNEFVDAAVNVGRISTIDLAIYHARLAPRRSDSVRAWTSLLEAAAAVVRAGPTRALELIDAIDHLPSDAHVRMSHVIANRAAAGTGSVGERRRRITSATHWARRARSRDARRLISAWTGWLRVYEGRHQAACSLQKRAARLAGRGRGRATALCNAAQAAVEAGDLKDATGLAREGLRVAGAQRDAINAGRAEMLLRQVGYRTKTVSAVDYELLQSAERLGTAITPGLMALYEAAGAWRARRLEEAEKLAIRAADTLTRGGHHAAAMTARALAVRSGARAEFVVPYLADATASSLPPGIAAQVAALSQASLGSAAVPHDLRERGRRWAESIGRTTERREVLSPEEVSEALSD